MINNIDQVLNIIEQYRSPVDEFSIAKNIPLKYLNMFYMYSKKVKPLRIRYRGKSKFNYKRPQEHCHKVMADSFAIYVR